MTRNLPDFVGQRLPTRRNNGEVERLLPYKVGKHR